MNFGDDSKRSWSHIKLLGWLHSVPVPSISKKNTKIPVSSDLDFRHQTSKILKWMMYPLDCIIIFARKPSRCSGLDSRWMKPHQSHSAPKQLKRSGCKRLSRSISNNSSATWQTSICCKVTWERWLLPIDPEGAQVLLGDAFFFAQPLAHQITSSLNAS